MARPVTIIQPNTQVNGRLEGAEDVEVLGSIRGSVQLEGDLFVDTQAQVQADVEVTRLEVRGILVGSALATQSIELFAEAKVIGDLTSPKVIIHEGALYRGTIDMGGEDVAADSRGRSAAPRRAPTRPAPRPTSRPAAPAPTPKATPVVAEPPTKPEKAPVSSKKPSKKSK